MSRFIRPTVGDIFPCHRKDPTFRLAHSSNLRFVERDIGQHARRQPPICGLGTSLRRPSFVDAASDDVCGASDQQPREEFPRSPEAQSSDHVLVERAREGDDSAATQLYVRYAKRLMALVKKRWTPELVRAEGVEDIVQSVFRTLFQRIGQGYYEVPDGHELWRLLLVIAVNKIRGKTAYYRTVKRDRHRSADGSKLQQRIESQETARDEAADHLELALKELLDRLPPQSQLIANLRIDGHSVADIVGITGRSNAASNASSRTRA